MQTSNSLKPAQARSDRGVDEMRTRLHGMWAGVAPAWGQHADYVDARARWSRSACSRWEIPNLVSGCSSWPAGLADSG
jgi:hypothetical protein